MKFQNQIDQSHYHSSDGFIHHYQKLIKDVVIPYQYEILNDRIEGAEKSHVIANFINAGKALRGEDVGDGFYGMVFQDSDAAKWLEAVGFSLVIFPDAALEAKADALIDIIAAAQDTDGYLNTYYTIKDRDKRWTNLCEGHELYCAGHMMEAACAYYEATGKKTLLDVMEKNAEHIYQHFITEKREGYPGHPEVELALLKMYRATKNKHCLALAEHFINVRGVNPHFFDETEKKLRDWTVWGNDGKDLDYAQNAKPVREQTDAVGHSVRAVYLYTAMADLASETDDESLIQACDTLWNSIVNKRMYITGGIGSTGTGEAFTVDYDLPNDTAYAETCASIGLMFFASRMLEMKPDAKYTDIMEKAFYNTVLAGMQLDGKRFFYVNPLEVVQGISDVAVTHTHVKTTRPTWYACACCPPNVARLVSSFGKYAYGENDTTCFCHLFAEGTVSFQNGAALTCTTAYPYDMTIQYKVEKGGKDLAIRIPSWSSNTKVMVNESLINLSALRGSKINGTHIDSDSTAGAKQEVCATVKNGYLYLSHLCTGDTVTLTLDDKIRRIYCSSKVPANSGSVAFARGPLVYCAEGTDNNGEVLDLIAKEDGTLTANAFQTSLLEGTQTITIEGYKAKEASVSTTDTGCNTSKLYSNTKPQRIPYSITAIPYYTWGNRGETNMRVWIPER